MFLDCLNNLIIFESIENWKIKKIYNSRYYEAWKTTTVKSKEIIEIPIPSIVDLEHADNVITISAWNNGNSVFNLSQGNNPKKNFSIYFDNDSLSRAICIQIKIKYR